METAADVGHGGPLLDGLHPGGETGAGDHLGHDQSAHLKQTRWISRRSNHNITELRDWTEQYKYYRLDLFCFLLHL